MHTVSWKEVPYSDAPNCDECNIPFGNEKRLLGEDEEKHQFVIHSRCKKSWLKRTGYLDSDSNR
jgi:hypothetical protein